MEFDGQPLDGNGKNNIHNSLCTPTSVLTDRSEQKNNILTKHVMCKIHKSGSLFTYENDHYMVIDMKWMDKVCKYYIRYSDSNKEKLPYTANICYSTCIE